MADEGSPELKRRRKEGQQVASSGNEMEDVKKLLKLGMCKAYFCLAVCNNSSIQMNIFQLFWKEKKSLLSPTAILIMVWKSLKH